MAKNAARDKGTKAKAKTKAKARGSKRSRERAGGPVIERARPPARPTRAEPMRLAAEVARLEFELAVARAQMVDLVARAETDVLTDLVNRRGFQPGVRGSLALCKRYGTPCARLPF